MRRATLLSVLLVAAFAADARACSCVSADMVLPDAERVFVGTVAERQSAGRGLLYTFDVERVVRGDVPPRVKLRAATQDGASCGVDLAVGERRTVMLTQPGDEVNMCQIADPEFVGAAPVAPAVTALLGRVLSACVQVARWTFSAR